MEVKIELGYQPTVSNIYGYVVYSRKYFRTSLEIESYLY